VRIKFLIRILPNPVKSTHLCLNSYHPDVKTSLHIGSQWNVGFVMIYNSIFICCHSYYKDIGPFSQIWIQLV